MSRAKKLNLDLDKFIATNDCLSYQLEFYGYIFGAIMQKIVLCIKYINSFDSIQSTKFEQNEIQKNERQSNGCFSL